MIETMDKSTLVRKEFIWLKCPESWSVEDAKAGKLKAGPWKQELKRMP